jgi:transglutaminase-like putative cysteine protease
VALAIGAVALYVADGIGPLALGAIFGSLIVTAGLGRFIARERSVGSRIWQGAAAFALVAYFLDILLLRRDLLASSLILTVFITIFVIFNARGVEDDRRLLLVSFLHVVLAAALTTEVTIALPLVGWLLAVIHGLMARTAIPRARGASTQRAAVDLDMRRLRYAVPCLGAGAAVLVTCLAVFVVVPHFGTGAFRPGMFRRQSLTGFSDTTSLGDIGRIKLDRSKVMEVELSGARPADVDLRWRGLALNEFDGRTWTRSYSRYSRHAADDGSRFFPDGGRLNAAPERTPATANLLTQEIRLEPGTTRAVFSAAHPRVVESRDFRWLGEDGFGNLELPAKPTRRLKYTVASELPPRDAGLLRRAAGDDPRQVRALNLALPALDPRIPALARDITANAATRYDAAVAVEQWLSSRLAYSLAVDDRGAADPLTRFLFDGMAGHCEYFATAMVVLAREADIPTRFVAGYLRGERGRFGERYLVRQSDAHSWVEVYFPGLGWVPFDPTPPAGRNVAEAGSLWALVTYLQSSMTRLWDDYLVGIDLDDQARGLLALTSAVNAMSDRLRGVWTSVAAWHPLRIALLVISLGLLAYVGRRTPQLWRLRERRKRARRSGTTVPSFYAAAVALLSKSGLSRRPGETPAEFAARAESLLTRHAADRLGELTRLYYRVRFDGVTSERRVARIARALLGDVRAGLRKPG